MDKKSYADLLEELVKAEHNFQDKEEEYQLAKVWLETAASELEKFWEDNSIEPVLIFNRDILRQEVLYIQYADE